MRWCSFILCIVIFWGVIYFSTNKDSIELVKSDGFQCEMNVENVHPVFLLANGGSYTTPDSPIGEKNSSLILVNHVEHTKENILAFAKALKQEQTPTYGFPCIIIQNNPKFINQINQELDPEYQLKAIATLGLNQTLFVINSYAEDHQQNIEGTLDAIFNTANLLKTNSSYLKKASLLTADFYQENNAEYWETYFTIQQKKNDLFVHNLEDNLFSMGLAPNSENTIARIYNDETVDNTYIKYLIMTRKLPSVTASSHLVYFDLGKTDIKPEAENILREILTKIDTNTILYVIGHTDNKGREPINLKISEQRAKTVRNWIINKLPNIKTIKTSGVGSSEPVVSNDTEEGRAKNRRVQIILQN